MCEDGVEPPKIHIQPASAPDIPRCRLCSLEEWSSAPCLLSFSSAGLCTYSPATASKRGRPRWIVTFTKSQSRKAFHLVWFPLPVAKPFLGILHLSINISTNPSHGRSRPTGGGSLMQASSARVSSHLDSHLTKRLFTFPAHQPARSARSGHPLSSRLS